MSTDPDRDLSDDRLLRAALAPGSPGSGDACLDAETLAAWSDGSLPASLTADIDRHLATCARCQAMMAAFGTADVDAMSAGPAAAATPAAVFPFRPRSPMRWLIPLAVGTLAASLIIWTAWPKPGLPVAPDQALAKMESAMAPAVPANEPAQARSADAAADETRQARRVARSNTQGQGRQGQGVAESKAAPVTTAAPSPVATTAGAVALPPASATVPPPPPVQPPVNPPAAAGAAAGTRPEIVMLRSAADAAKADATDPRASRVVAEFAPVTTATPGLAQPFATGARAGAGGAGGGGRGGGGARTASAPERVAPRIRWRVLASGKVEKSLNGGEAWDPVAIGPPAVILNGAAPSASVCWLVGRAGIVLLSTDGVTFTRVRFPDVSDLRSITAVDAREASITTTDGRIFETADAGETWTLKNGVRSVPGVIF